MTEADTTLLKEGRGTSPFSCGYVWVLLIVLLLVIDQTIKITVKTHMYLHDSIRITDWFYILFTENNGMAFGMEVFDKLFLTVFRIVAVIAIGWALRRFIKAGVKPGFLLCTCLIFTGALGNIIDSLFYGVFFTESSYQQIATFLPHGGGYAPPFYGKVVDMFYFPIIDTYWPDWMPLWGGEHFVFFSPIFNFADACISVGIIAVLVFYYKYVNTAFAALKIAKKERKSKAEE